MGTTKENLPSVHHLLFADGIFIFTHSTLHKCVQVKLLLKSYEEASRQVVNFSKSCVAFSGNVNEFDGHLLANFLGVATIEFHESYICLFKR